MFFVGILERGLHNMEQEQKEIFQNKHFAGHFVPALCLNRRFV